MATTEALRPLSCKVMQAMHAKHTSTKTSFYLLPPPQAVLALTHQAVADD